MRKQIDDLVGLKQIGVGVCVPGGDKEQGMVHKSPPPHAWDLVGGCVPGGGGG